VEVGLGFEDAACNEVSLDLGEPDLDLIEPRGIGRGEMELDVGTDAQKLLNGFSFMSRKVVGDDMNMGFGGLSSDHLGEELHELGAGVTVSCLSQDLAGGRIQGRIERKSAVAKVFESVTFGPARRERQDGIETIKGWNGALFIDTENSRMGRRLQVETDDCGRLLLKLRVIADHVVATPVRLQPCLSPHPGHTHMVNAERGPQLAAAPMGGTIGGLAVQVQSMIRASSFSMPSLGARPRCRLQSPGKRCSLKRSRHIRTVLILQPSCRLIAQRLREPEAKLRIILARRASSARNCDYDSCVEVDGVPGDSK
jgi:hypothetical protein